MISAIASIGMIPFTPRVKQVPITYSSGGYESKRRILDDYHAVDLQTAPYKSKTSRVLNDYKFYNRKPYIPTVGTTINLSF